MNKLCLTFVTCAIFLVTGIIESEAVLIDLAGGAGTVSDITIGGITFDGSSTTIADLDVHQNGNGLGVREDVLGATNQIDGLTNGNETLTGTVASSMFNSTTLSQIRPNDNALIKIDGAVVFEGDIPDDGFINLGGVIGTMIEYTVSNPLTDDYKVLSINIDPANNGSSPVPEPGSFALLGLGLIALCGFKRKK